MSSEEIYVYSKAVSLPGSPRSWTGQLSIRPPAETGPNANGRYLFSFEQTVVDDSGVVNELKVHWYQLSFYPHLGKALVNQYEKRVCQKWGVEVFDVYMDFYIYELHTSGESDESE